MIRYYLQIILGGLLLVTVSCSDSTFEDRSTEQGYDYFPLGLGNEWIYQVDSVVYQSGGSEILRSTSFVKEEITDVLNEQDSSYILTRSSRRSTDSPWLVTDVFVLERDSERAYRTEDNRRFIKLAFPIRDGKSWDGNIFFDSSADIDVFGNQFPVYEGWQYEIVVEPESVEILGQVYDDVITIKHVDRDDKLSWSKSLEQYAKGIGLIYKQHLFLDTEQLLSTEPWEEKAEAGFSFEQRLLSYK